jgi:hypothetical protein
LRNKLRPLPSTTRWPYSAESQSHLSGETATSAAYFVLLWKTSTNLVRG